MKNPVTKLCLIIALVLLFGWKLYPPEDNLRLGRDLAGGTALTYTIELQPGDTDETVNRMIDVLRTRVNPRGLFEISFVRQGRDRLIVSMPLPTERVRELRAAFDAQVERLVSYDLDAPALERALRAKGQSREDALRAMMDSEAHIAMLQPVLDASLVAESAEAAFLAADDALEELNRQLSAVQEDEAATIEQIESATAARDSAAGVRQTALLAAASAAEALEEAKNTALASRVSGESVRSALQLSDQPLLIREQAGGEVEKLPSPRETSIRLIRNRLANLSDEKAAVANEILDAVVASWEAFEAERSGLDDPADLERLLRGSGVLEFRIAAQAGPRDVPLNEQERLREELRELGPAGVQSTSYVWREINKLADWYDTLEELDVLLEDPAGYISSRGFIGERTQDGRYFLLVSDERGRRLTQAEGQGDWGVSQAFASRDEFGRNAIGFQMDPKGASLLGQMTADNIQEPMVILLDDKVYSTPATIQSRISSNGQITGTFSGEDIAYVVQTLSAGSLSARLSEEPIGRNNIAPELGADNLARGLEAGWIALAAVGIFMIVYYFFHGIVAWIALLANAILILGVMSLAQAAFTLPGIAGIVLTFGMAVDANVLIYERIREELLAGEDLRTAVRLAYQKVLSTIVDANITNLIVCFVLGYLATEEVKGFAITLGIGVIATMFSALIISRVIYTVLLERIGVRKMSQLPMVVPVLQRSLEPKINFVGLRPIFLVISLAFVSLGIGMIIYQGEEMLDTEFRGGTAVTLQLKQDEAGNQLTMTRQEVEERVRALAEEAAEEVESAGGDGSLVENAFLIKLRNADVVALDPEADGATSDTFQVKSIIGGEQTTAARQDRQRLLDALVETFDDVVESQPALAFIDSQAEQVISAPVYKVLFPALGDSIRLRNADASAIRDNVAEFQNGAVVILEDFDPKPTLESLQSRLTLTRESSEFASTALKRNVELLVLEGTDEAVESAAILISDPAITALDDDSWRNNLAAEEWRIAQAAFTTSTTLAGVQQFSQEIAAGFRGQAIFAVAVSFLLILVYIWVRFGSPRYSIAAITALAHDVLIAIGLIALAEILYEHVPALRSLGLQPYKIDLALVAAVLTIVGYSLNDTIVILDRVRENRGKLAYASKEVVNRSIQETISRTVVTSGTTLVALLVLFSSGGDALSSFTYALICGVIVGTYSSIAVAAPLVYTSKIPDAARRFAGGDGGDDKPRIGPADAS